MKRTIHVYSKLIKPNYFHTIESIVIEHLLQVNLDDVENDRLAKLAKHVKLESYFSNSALHSDFLQLSGLARCSASKPTAPPPSRRKSTDTAPAACRSLVTKGDLHLQRLPIAIWYFHVCQKHMIQE